MSGRAKSAVIAVAAVVLVAAVAAGAIVLANRGDDASTPESKTAAIVDQLSLTQANPQFVSQARGLLEGAGYRVDYFPGDQVTVDFYRTLPKRGYDLIILRAHAGITTEVDLSSGERKETEYVSLFTGEPYSAEKYAQEQLDRLGKAVYYEGAPPLFGIGPRFVEESMDGGFEGALIIMMGCDGLRSQRTAEAFLHKGASAFVSWSQPVTADHTDAATERLLEHLLRDGFSTADAVSRTASEIGPDPSYGAELRMLAQQ